MIRRRLLAVRAWITRLTHAPAARLAWLDWSLVTAVVSRKERERARRISEYVDRMVVHRRNDADELEALVAADDELKKLRKVARLLSDVHIAAPVAEWEEVTRQLSAEMMRASQPKVQTLRGAVWSSLCDGTSEVAHAAVRLVCGLPSAVRGAGIAILAAFLVLMLAPNVPEVRVASAADILDRSDLALSSRVRPGEILYRQWRTVSAAWPNAGAAVASERVRIQHEWMDGADFSRVAGRWYDSDGRLIVAYATIDQGGEPRAQVYLAAGTYGERDGSLHIEPSPNEFERALEDFPQAQRAALRLILKRHYIYMPIAGERHFNQRLMEERENATPALPRMILSFDERVVDDERVYRVRIVDPVRIRFHWRADGPPVVQRSRAEIVRFIAQGSFLSTRSEETYEFEDGRRTFAVRELVEMQVVSVSDLPMNPFRLDDVPEGTIGRRQSAKEWLTEVDGALSRVTGSPLLR